MKTGARTQKTKTYRPWIRLCIAACAIAAFGCTADVGEEGASEDDSDIAAYAASSYPAIGEVGRRNVSQSGANAWHTVSLSRAYTKPVVIMAPPTQNGGDPTTIRVKNVTSSSFRFQLDEWDYRDGVHGKETVHFMVIEAGVHTLPDGTVVEAGRKAQNHTWGHVKLSGFDARPTVLTQATTRNGSAAVVTRVRSVNASGFDVRLQEEEGADGTHATETVGYVAFEMHSGNAGLKFRAGRSGEQVTNNWTTLSGPSQFSNPFFLAQIQTYAGSDPAGLRYRIKNGNVDVRVEEEKSKDAETGHGAEAVGWVVFEKAGTIRGVGSCAGASPGTTELDAEEEEFLQLINNYRKGRGLTALNACTSLSRASQGYSEDMRDDDFFSHTGLDGSSASDRSCDACYMLGCGPQTLIAENLAAGYSTAAAVFNGWKNSSGHNANMLRSDARVIGIGRATGGGTYGVYWTTVFGGEWEASCN